MAVQNSSTVWVLTHLSKKMCMNIPEKFFKNSIFICSFPELKCVVNLIEVSDYILKLWN